MTRDRSISRHQLLGIRVLGPLLLAALAHSVAEAQKPAKGKVQKGVYHTPAGIFAVPVPKGFRISDGHFSDRGAVAFHDDFGRLMAIHYATDSAVQSSSESAGADSASSLSAWLHGFALDAWFTPVSPDRRVLAEAEGSFEGIPALFALIDAPGAHTLESMTLENGKMQRRREDSRRVAVLFRRDRHIYLLMTETVTMGFSSTGAARPDEDWRRRAEELAPLYRSIVFR
jgi:hypothetical protein